MDASRKRERAVARHEGRPRVRSLGRTWIFGSRPERDWIFRPVVQHGLCQPTEAEGWWHCKNQVFGSPRPDGTTLSDGSLEVTERSMSDRDCSTCTSSIAHAVLALAISWWDVPVLTTHTEFVSTSVFAGPGGKIENHAPGSRSFQRGVVCPVDEHHEDVGRRSC